jgi:aromatic amino acid transport protein AroP
VTHLKFKAYCQKTGKTTKFPSLWYPAADYFCLAFLCFIVLMMTQMPDMLTAVLIMPVWLAILWCCWRRLAPAPMMTHTMQKP